MKKITTILLAILYVIPSFAQTMEWHIRDNYADIQYLGNGVFKVKNTNDKWGIINEYGEITVEMLYDSITPIVEDRALLLDIDGISYLKGIVNEKGKIIKSFNKNEILTDFQCFNEGMLAYGVPIGEYYYFGYLDINGNTQIEPKYFWVSPFVDGKAVVQYASKNKNFSLISKTGAIEVNDNRNFKFMSTPVDGKLLIAVTTSRGDEILLVKLGPDKKLNEVEKLEKITSFDVKVTQGVYNSISYQNGHIYNFDNAMRLISSSTGAVFNEPLGYKTELLDNSNFNKVSEQGYLKILHSNNTLLSTSFADITFCDNEYAIVTSKRNTKGVLRLNNNGKILVQNVPSQVEFYHNVAVKTNLGVSLDGLFSSSQIQVGIVGLKDNNQEEKFNIPSGYNGIYNCPISYFIPATNFDSEVSLPITINVYIDGMLYRTEKKELTGIHKTAFKISDANALEYSDPDGNVTITFNVQSLEVAPSSSAKVVVKGASSLSKRFNGEELLYFKIPVVVPEESVKTFSFTVSVEENGCPSYTRTISRTIKHYDLK